MPRFMVCVFLALGVSVVVPLQPSYKYARQAGPLAGGGDRRQQGQGQRRPKALDAEN